MIAGIFLILMAIGCDAPADSAGVATLEQTFVDAPVSESSEADAAVSEPPADGSFGGFGEIDDPFAAIGPAFSGFGIQTHSSGCDPFEDAYGTCL